MRAFPMRAEDCNYLYIIILIYKLNKNNQKI